MIIYFVDSCHVETVLPVLAERLRGLPAILPEFSDVDVMGGLTSLYYDLAATVFPAQVSCLELMGVPQEHLLYGSDWPFTPLPLCAKLAERMDRELENKAAYLDNPRNLFSGL